MAKFASAKTQAASVIKILQGSTLKSVGTVRNYEQALTRVAEYAKAERLEGGLRGMTPEQALIYLEKRGQEVGQKTLDMERQAIQAMMRNVTQKLEDKDTLKVIKSEHEQILKSRAYSDPQVRAIASAQENKNKLSTEIARAAGLRAHELYTLRPLGERTADKRPANDTKFKGLTGVKYTVEGKGGLTREVMLPKNLADKLEQTRFETPQKVTDRNVHYWQQYNISAGNAWSSSFTAASKRVLTWSAGAHGLRHSYAQERMKLLQRYGLYRHKALETVSQELGHFRPEITEVYLR
jgi:integrase